MAKQLECLDRVPARVADEYVARRRPFAIRGAARHWPAVAKWTPAFLARTVGHHAVSQVSLDFKELVEFSFGEYLALLAHPVEEVGVLPYIRNKFVHELFPELTPDVCRLEWLQPTWLEREPLASMIRVMRPNWIDWCELFVSQPGVRYPLLHTDSCMFHAWCAQIHGTKRYWVWPAIPGFRDVDCLGQDLDTLLGVEPYSIDVGPGDVVVIPAGLPHVAESVTTSITIAGSYVDASNWVEFSDEFCQTELLRDLRRA